MNYIEKVERKENINERLKAAYEYAIYLEYYERYISGKKDSRST